MFSKGFMDHFALGRLPSLFEVQIHGRGFCRFQFEVFSNETLSFRHNDSPLNSVFQFTYITGPRVTFQSLHRVFAERQAIFSISNTAAAKEFLCEQANIASTLTQWRKTKHHYCKPVI